MVYRHLSGIDPERFITTQSYTVTTTPSTQAIPATYMSMLPYGCGIYLVDSDGDDTATQLPMTGFGSDQTGYYITAGNIVFTGAETQTYKMRFMPLITAIDGLTDYFTLDTTLTGKAIVPDGYEDFLIKAIDVYYDGWDEDIGMEGISDQRFVRLLDEFSRTIPRLPTVYGLDDPTLNF
jgi:hypothetical protein